MNVLLKTDFKPLNIATYNPGERQMYARLSGPNSFGNRTVELYYETEDGTEDVKYVVELQTVEDLA